MSIDVDDTKSVSRRKDNVGIILGEPSGWLVDVDLDCDEAIELADQYLPPTPAITGRPSAPRSHRWYIAAGATTEKAHRSAYDGSMIVELRSTGAQTVVGPSVHPDGETYETSMLNRQPFPRRCWPHASKHSRMRLTVNVACAATAIKPPHCRHSRRVRAATSKRGRLPTSARCRPRSPAVAVTRKPTLPRRRSFTASASIRAAALAILTDHYNPRCSPPWSDKELQHKINQAATKPHDRPFGWLRDDGPIEPMQRCRPQPVHGWPRSQPVIDQPPSTHRTSALDPGQLPERLFNVPGFVRRVMDFTLANAPYPNIGLAFCGAMALQSFLAGRKVCTSGDLRTNLYLLALASSGTGKEFPRKVNSQILFQIGMSASLGDKFASGEGIQDALVRTGRMLFQNDEMDGVLRQINLDRENSRESIPNILLTLYTSAGDVYPIRVKANQKDAIHVDQPHLTLFGTATPQYFYESLSKRMLTNGFFARLNIIDVGKPWHRAIAGFGTRSS